MSYLLNAADFLLSMLLNFVSIIFLLAIMLYRYRLLFMGNELYRLLIRFTSKAVIIVPPVVGSERERIALVLVALLAQYLKLLFHIFIGLMPQLYVEGFLLLGFAALFQLVVHIYMFCILVLVVLSWVAQARSIAHSPVVDILMALTEPLMRALRRAIPPMGNLDFTPMIAMVALYLSLLLLYQPVADFAWSLR